MYNEWDLSAGCMIALVTLVVSMLPAWITHVIVTIQAEQWILLVVGAIVWPVGVVHGWGIWFGAF